MFNNGFMRPYVRSYGLLDRILPYGTVRTPYAATKVSVQGRAAAVFFFWAVFLLLQLYTYAVATATAWTLFAFFIKTAVVGLEPDAQRSSDRRSNLWASVRILIFTNGFMRPNVRS